MFGQTTNFVEWYKNRQHQREFKGAFTNSASLDNNELNYLKYYDGGAKNLDSAQPKTFVNKQDQNDNHNLFDVHQDSEDDDQ